MPNEKSLKNLEKRKKFKKAPQGLDEAKSNGQIDLSKKTNLLCNARTLFENAQILPDLVDSLKAEVKAGETKNAIKFFDVIKEPEDKNININGGLEVQKVFITQEEKQEALNHIDDFIV